MYLTTTPQGSTCGQTPVWPGEDATWARCAAHNETLRAESSGFDGNVKETNTIQIIAFDDYRELLPFANNFGTLIYVVF